MKATQQNLPTKFHAMLYKLFYRATLLFLLHTIILRSANAQIDTRIKIDLLRGPSSPASSLLGLSTSDIEKPSDVNAFMASLKNATNNFSSLPKSYAIDFAPFKIFSKKYLDSKFLDSNKYRIRQTAVISLAVNTVDKNDSSIQSTSKTQFGIGIKFSIIRGKIDDQSNAAFKNIYFLQQKDEENRIVAFRAFELKNLDDRHNSLFEEIHDKKNLHTKKEVDSLTIVLQQIDDQRRNILLSNLSKTNDSSKLYTEKIKTEVAKIKLERTGFNLDFSAGTVIDFLNGKFNNLFYN